MSNFDPAWGAKQRLEIISQLAGFLLKDESVPPSAKLFILAISDLATGSVEHLEIHKPIIEKMLELGEADD